MLSKAMERSPPHNQVTLQPLGQAPTVGVPREVVAALEARLAALETRTHGVEHISTEALRVSSAASENLEERIFKFGTALSRAEAELASLRQGLAGGQQQREQLEARLQQAVNARIEANSELQDQKFRLENAEREAHEAKALAQRLEGLVAYEKDLFSQDNMTRQDHQIALREEARRREAALSRELVEMSREVEVAKQWAGAARQEGMVAFDQLAARLDAAESYLGQQQQQREQQQGGGQDGGAAIQGDIMELQGQIQNLQAQLIELDASRRNDQQLAAIGAKDLEGKVAAAEADVLKRTMNVVESRNKELLRRYEGLEEQVNDRLNSKAADDDDRLNHVAKGVAREKKNALERMIVMERSVRDLLAKQEETDEATRRLVQRGQEEFIGLVSRSKAEQEEREAMLREQVNSALVKIRGYTRDMEEALERERLGLEEVLRMEIKSRMSNTTKLKDALAKTKHEVRGELKGLRSGLTERLEHLEKKLQVLLAAERKLYARQTDLEGGLTRHTRHLDQKLGLLTDELEGLVVDQVLNEDIMKEDVIGQLETGYNVLREALSAELMTELADLKDRNDADLMEALDAIEEDHSAFQEDIQRQVTVLSEQSSADLHLIHQVAADTRAYREEGNTALEGMQMQLDEMLDGLVEEIEQSAERAGELKAEIHQAFQDQLSEVTEQLTHVQGRVDDIQYAQQVLHEDLEATDGRGRKLMDVLEQEVEAREAGVDRLSESLAGLEAKAAQDLDDLRQAAAADREQVLKREEALAEEMSQQFSDFKDGQDQLCQDLDEVAGAVAELPGQAELDELEVRLATKVEASQKSLQTDTQMAQETADSAMVEAQAARDAAEALCEANAEGRRTIEDRLAKVEEEMVTGPTLAEALLGQVTPESVANLREEVAELQSDLKLTEEILRAEVDVVVERAEATDHSVAELSTALDGLAETMASSEAMVSAAVTADDVQDLRDVLDAVQTAVAKTSQATADLAGEMQGPLKEELAQLVEDRLAPLRDEMLAAGTRAQAAHAVMDNLAALRDKVEQLAASAHLQEGRQEERLAGVEEQIAQQRQDETDLSIISAELHAKVQALSTSMLKKLDGLREEMLDNMTDTKLDSEALRAELMQGMEGLAQIVEPEEMAQEPAPDGVAAEDSQQSAINVKLVEASEFHARRMSTLENHAEEFENQLSSELNDWTGKLVETQEMVSERLGHLEGQSDELMRSMSSVRRTIGSMQSDMDELHAQLQGHQSLSEGPSPGAADTAQLAGAQEALTFRLQSLERQAAMGPEPGEFNRAITTVMEMLGGLQADMDQIRTDVDGLSADAALADDPSELCNGLAALSAKVEALEAVSDLTRAHGEAQTAVAEVVKGLQAEVESLRADVQDALDGAGAAGESAQAAETSAESAAAAARGAIEALEALQTDLSERAAGAVPSDKPTNHQARLDSTLQRVEALEAANNAAAKSVTALETRLGEWTGDVEGLRGTVEQTEALSSLVRAVELRVEQLEATGTAAKESVAALEAILSDRIEAVERSSEVFVALSASEERIGQLETVGAATVEAVSALRSKMDETAEDNASTDVGIQLETKLTEQVGALNSRVEAMESAQETWQQPVETVEARVGALEGRVEAVEAQLASLRDDNGEAAEKDQSLVMERIGVVESSLEEKLVTMGSRVQELSDAASAAAEVRGPEDLGAIEERLAVVETRINNDLSGANGLSSAEKTASTAAGMAESALQAATAGLKELREKIGVAEAGRKEAETGLENSTSAVREQVEAVVSTVEALRSELAQLQKQSEGTTAAPEAPEGLEEEVRSIRSDVESLSETTQSLQQSQVAVEGAANWPTALAEAKKEIVERLDEQQRSIETLQLRLEEMTSVDERMGEVQEALGVAQTDLAELRGQLQGHHATLDQHAEDLKILEGSVSAAKGSEGKADAAAEELQAVKAEVAEHSTRLTAQKEELTKVAESMVTQQTVSEMLADALRKTSTSTSTSTSTDPKGTEGEEESGRVWLVAQAERISQLEANMLGSGAVQEQILDVITEQELVSHQEVQHMLEALKEEVTSEMDAGRDIQNELAESYEEVLSDIGQQVKDLEERLEGKDKELRGVVTDEMEGQLEEWRAEILQELKESGR